MIRRGASSMRLLLAMHPYQPDMYRPTLVILALWIKGMNQLDLRETIKKYVAQSRRMRDFATF